MDLGKEFVRAVKQLEKEKKLNVSIITYALESALVSAYKKHSGGQRNVRVEVDIENGTISVYELKQIVERVSNPNAEISLEEARERGFDARIGDVVEVEVDPEEFGRIAAQTARQVVMQRIREAEREQLYKDLYHQVGQMVSGVVFRVEEGDVLVGVDGLEAMLRADEQIPGEEYAPGRRMKFLLLNVKKTNKGPLLELSRTHPDLLRRLLEMHVPEIKEGVVEIKRVAREAGDRSKVAVVSYDPNVDPVGTCIGPKGARIKAISEELSGERVDLVQWDSDPLKFVRNALNPAEIVDIKLMPEEKAVRVFVPANQLSLAIGKKGQNVRLAARLTGYKIDIKPHGGVQRGPTLRDILIDALQKDEELWGDLRSGRD